MNNAVLVGRLTRDPETRTTQSGIAVTSFTLAVDRRFKDKETGEYGADFIRCTAWRQTAEFIDKYFRKGSKLGVIGSIQTGSYEKDGRTVYTTEVVVDEAYFVEPKAAAEKRQDEEYDKAERGAIESEPAMAPAPEDTKLPFDL